MHKHVISCGNCQHESVSSEPFTVLSFALPLSGNSMVKKDCYITTMKTPSLLINAHSAARKEKALGKRERFSVALYATEERSPKMKNSTQTTLLHFNFSVTAEFNDVTSILINEEINKANCMVINSAKLDCRTKQHTQFGVSTSSGKKKKKKKKKEEKKKKKEREQNHIASHTGIANNHPEDATDTRSSLNPFTPPPITYFLCCKVLCLFSGYFL